MEISLGCFALCSENRLLRIIMGKSGDSFRECGRDRKNNSTREVSRRKRVNGNENVLIYPEYVIHVDLKADAMSSYRLGEDCLGILRQGLLCLHDDSSTTSAFVKTECDPYII
ncbi:hypothetical protein AVEN_251160-1 [Araneus ventricosus]|uniref:Uncharacterized protein n=1 Tax=Araneus ventricosus TaxID=182803 RepID=A0A4Y2I9E5_ARAVE|nr:hypothetical protein AVEN_251160-1 [Araneus ventricosus]